MVDDDNLGRGCLQREIDRVAAKPKQPLNFDIQQPSVLVLHTVVVCGSGGDLYRKQMRIGFL